MGTWASVGAVGAAAVAGAAVLLNLPTNPWVAKPQKATLEYLEQAKLATLDGSQRSFDASDLWRERGAVIMAVRRPG